MRKLQTLFRTKSVRGLVATLGITAGIFFTLAIIYFYVYLPSITNHGESIVMRILDKTALLLAASPGSFGGVRGLNHLRDIISRLGVLTWPDMMTVGNADAAFDAAGGFVDGKQQARLEKLVAAMLQLSETRQRN